MASSRPRSYCREVLKSGPSAEFPGAKTEDDDIIEEPVPSKVSKEIFYLSLFP